jgi:uncharacterized protein YbjT (DUF2867 family)
MIVLLVGASGFLGCAVHAALLQAGHEVIATYHRKPAPGWPQAQTRWRRAHVGSLDRGQWLAVMDGAQAVINCAGVLQDSPWESTGLVHAQGLASLIAACEAAHVRRFIHFSAIGADRHEPTAFSRSKRQGEELVTASFLDWVILRPSVVVGRGAFGGSALFRGLAALPVLPVMPGTGPLQIVQRQDVVRTVLHFLDMNAPARLALDLAGPERLSMTEVVTLYRRWLGWRPARHVRMPSWLAMLAYRLGDLARWLGWRPPLSSTAQREMVYGAVGDGAKWRSVTAIVPQRLEDALAAEPASVQERWFAGLYFLKAVGFAIFSLFWITTAVISLTVGYPIGVSLMLEGGVGSLAGPSVVAGALADLAIGLAIAFRPTARIGLYGALVLSLFYVLSGSILLPRLWAEPLGPLVKIWPVLVLNLVLLAILEER